MNGFLKVLCLLIGAVSQAYLYAECVSMGKFENTFSLPLFSVALNLIWSGLLALSDLFYVHRFRLLTVIAIVWLVQLMALLRLWFSNAAKEATTSVLMKVYLIPWTVIVLAAVFAVSFLMYAVFGTENAQIFSACLIMMADPLLMLKMLDDRRSTRGQSRSAAASLMASSIIFSLYGLLRLKALMVGCGLISLLFAGIYYWALQGYQAAEDHRTVHVYDLVRELQQKIGHKT